MAEIRHNGSEQGIFKDALDLDSAEARLSFVEAACGDDSALLKRVRSLLQAYDENSHFLGESEDSDSRKTLLCPIPFEVRPGVTIGRYKLLEQIGEGGCGVVYMAEQTEPLRRRVALKVIKLGMDTKSVIARFEAERQALALMDHPNIARVLDAGATEAGRPYFVMELVRGTRITDYCDQQCLSTRDRLELFIRVCHAVQHAHQKGIIHRDLKPSNILVTLHDGVAMPKVIDFGIAKATTDQRLTDKTLFTSLDQFIGTPAYMSPEQAEMSGLDLDTRCDIYSLGVLLYEILTGKTPFDPKALLQSGLAEMRRIIRDQEPVRPSTRLSAMLQNELTTTAKRRQIDAPRLIHLLRGDLDWIVMKCLEKDRSRRYETAYSLATDLDRYLRYEPVLARSPSTSYRFQKAFRRNKVLFLAAGCVGLSLVAGLGTTIWLYLRESEAHRVAHTAELEQARLRGIAQNALDGEKQQRKRAEEQELEARRWAYASDMRAAKQALDENNLGRAVELLNHQRPKAAQSDLRGWEWRYLWSQTRSDALFSLGQKESEIYSLSVSDDGSLLVSTGRSSGGLSIWDLRTRRELFHFAEDQNDLRAVVAPAGNFIAFAGRDSETQFKLRVWVAASQEIVFQTPLDGECAGLAVARDGKTLVTSTVGGRITLWQMPGGLRLADYPTGQTESIGSAFSAAPDLSVAAYAEARELWVIDLRTGHKRMVAITAKDIAALALSPDGSIAASCSGYEQGTIQLWQIETGKELGHLEGHRSWVTSFSFWPDGSKLASGSADHTIRIWNVPGRACLDTLSGHHQEVWRTSLVPNNNTLVSGAKDGTISVWDLSVIHPRQSHISFEGPYANWNFDPNGKSLLTVSGKGLVTRWSGKEFQQGETLLDAQLHAGDVSSPANISSNGRYVAIAPAEEDLQVWDIQQRRLVRKWANVPGKIGALYLLDGGSRLYGNIYDHDLGVVWDLASGSITQSWKAIPQLCAGAFSMNGRYLISAGRQSEVKLQDLTHATSRTLQIQIRQPTDFGFSPDEKLLVGASSLGFARVWEFATQREITTLRGFLNGVTGVFFSPVEKRLAVFGEYADSLRIWDTESWLETISLRGDTAQFWPALFSPDGNSVGARENNTGRLQVWHAPSWDEINRIEAKETQESNRYDFPVHEKTNLNFRSLTPASVSEGN